MGLDCAVHCPLSILLQGALVRLQGPRTMECACARMTLFEDCRRDSASVSPTWMEVTRTRAVTRAKQAILT